MFPFYLLVTIGYLVNTSGYLVVTSGYFIAATGYFCLLLVTSCYFWFLVLLTTPNVYFFVSMRKVRQNKLNPTNWKVWI